MTRLEFLDMNITYALIGEDYDEVRSLLKVEKQDNIIP